MSKISLFTIRLHRLYFWPQLRRNLMTSGIRCEASAQAAVEDKTPKPPKAKVVKEKIQKPVEETSKPVDETLKPIDEVLKPIKVLQHDAKPFETPAADGQEKVYSSKIAKIVEEIANMTLLEVADLNEALRKKLNVPDVAMYSGPMMAGPAVGGQAAAKKDDEEEAAPVVAGKTSFTCKLVKYNEEDKSMKTSLIKEVKTIIPELNLVQAKKLIESIPAVIVKDVGKAEAEKVKEALTKFGGICEIE